MIPARKNGIESKGWVLAVAACTGLALFYSGVYYWSTWYHGRPELGKALWWHFMSWYGWGALLPGIFWNCRRLVRNGGRIRLVAGHFLAGWLFALLHCIILTTGARIEASVFQTGRSWLNLLTEFILPQNAPNDIFSYGAIVIAWHTFHSYKRLTERERKTAELENQLNLARLHALRMQLHPHFLFNTLNGIAGLNYENPRLANSMLAKLSQLLRLTLSEDATQETTLKQEVEFNQLYLELEQMRLGDRLKVSFDLPDDTLNALIPSLLLQPLIENAILHGIAPFAESGKISLVARRNESRLELTLSDSGPGLPDSSLSQERPGIGLSNTRTRLRQLYGDAYQFELVNPEVGGLVVRISLPFRTEETVKAAHSRS